MNTARLLVALGMIPPGVGAGVFVNLLVDRVPLRRPLRPLDAWPRRCPSVALAPLPPHPSDVVDAAEEDDPHIADGEEGAAAGNDPPAIDPAARNPAPDHLGTADVDLTGPAQFPAEAGAGSGPVAPTDPDDPSAPDDPETTDPETTDSETAGVDLTGPAQFPAEAAAGSGPVAPDDPTAPDDPETTDSETTDSENDTDAHQPHSGPVLIAYEEGQGHGTPVETRPFRRRRCPACGAKAPVRYLVVEVLMGALFAATILRFGADWVVPAYLVLFVCLVAVSAVDLDYHIIPNRIVYPTIFAALPLLGLAAVASGDTKGLREALAGGAYAWVALLVIHLISPRGMGFGDVRLAFILGLFLGWLTMAHVATGIFMGFVLGAVIGVSLIAVGLKGRRDAIPFGPFLAAGTALTIFVGGPIIRWWIG